MKFKILFVTLLFFVSVSNSQPWALVWEDEFDYNGLPNPNKWSYDVGGAGWGNNELQYYTDGRLNNAKVENGNLIITAIKESYGANNYTSARLISKGKGDWLYGRIEVRAKLPVGRGTWPAIWMLPTDWAYGGWPNSGEIDIMEHVGYDPGRVHGTVHTKAYNHSIGTQKGGNLVIADAQSAFHTYAIEWNADTIMFYIDSQKYFMFTRESTWEKWPFDKRFHLLLNIAVGGNWGGAEGVDETIFPATMAIDYVRVYKRLEGLNIEGEQFVKEGQQSLEYKVRAIENSNYTWKVPSDATIVSGQGEPRIFVNWGNSDGKVELEVSLLGNKYNSETMVRTIIAPTVDTFVVDNYNDGILPEILIDNKPGNIVELKETGGALQINYQVADKALWPNAKIIFQKPIDLNNHEQMLVKLKTYNKSGSVVSRIDLIDVYGTETNGSKVFMLYPVISDGNFNTYKYNFDKSWVSSSPEYGKTVNKGKILGMRVYVNFGFYGTNNASDSLWINDVAFTAYDASVGIRDRQTQADYKIFPNPFQQTLLLDKQCNGCLLELSDMTGRTIFSKVIDDGALQVNVPSYLQDGFYLVKLTNSEKIVIFTQKLIHNK